MTLEDLVRLFFLVIATEAVTEILVDAKITEGLRQRIRCKAFPWVPEGQELPSPRLFWIFIADIAGCGYCASVWVAMWWGLFAPTFFSWEGNWSVLLIAWVINWLLAVVVLHRLSNWLHIGFSLLKNGRVRTYDIKLVNITEVDNGST